MSPKPPVTPAAPKLPVNPPALLAEAKNIAVVGYSADPAKISNFVPNVLRSRGWNIIPVNPNAAVIDGLKSYATLGDIPKDIKIDIVDVFRPAADTPEIAKQAAAIGAPTLWLQLGIKSEASRQIAEGAGMNFVEDTCMKLVAVNNDLKGPHYIPGNEIM